MQNSNSSLELLRGLKKEGLRLDDFWCDIAEVSKLCAAGLVKLDVADETLLLTEAGRSMIATPALKASSVRRPARDAGKSVSLRPPASGTRQHSL